MKECYWEAKRGETLVEKVFLKRIPRMAIAGGDRSARTEERKGLLEEGEHGTGLKDG